MSRINDLLRELKTREPALAKDLETEFFALADRRAFGLNFERHVPEAVELPGRKIRKGDKVRILPPRGQVSKKSDQGLWRVVKISRNQNVATLEIISDDSTSTEEKLISKRQPKIVKLDDLVVVAEFRDPIYPGLVSSGKISRGGDKPYQIIINAENYHALEALLFTHRGKVDCVYIDPPYNTGAKDWKYNNDYVENDDLYRHSKWLAFMERRLLLAKQLLNPTESVLIVTIDEKEYLRLGLLLEQTFSEAKVQMVSTIIKPEGTNRTGEFSRTNEFIYFVMFGAAKVLPVNDDMSGRSEENETTEKEIEWRNLRRRENTSVRAARPNQFYAIFIDQKKGIIHSVSDVIPEGVNRKTVKAPKGCVAVFPLKPDGTEMLWGKTPESFRKLVDQGFARVQNPETGEKATIQYLASGTVDKILSGEVKIVDKDSQGAVRGYFVDHTLMPKTTWSKESHNAQTAGTLILKALLPDRRFPFPKSLYAVEDALRIFIKNKPKAIVLDFFAGSGTTAHAVMRLNKQDQGVRQSISITNNEVAASEQSALREKNLRPGDNDWEMWGICNYITKPRVEAAISGVNSQGKPIDAEYKYTDKFLMSNGFKENAEFFNLTYESPMQVASNREFSKIAPLLWIRAGAEGRRIEDVSKGWDVADVYGVLADLDFGKHFLKAIAANKKVKIAFIVTDEERLFESVAQKLPDSVEPVRLYEAYLRNFEIESGRGSL